MKTMLRKMFALLLVVAMMTSTLAVAANAEGEAQTPAGGTEQGGQGGGEGGGGGGEGGGGGGSMMGGASKALDLSGMLSLKQYVFVKSEGEVKDGTVSTKLYGVYEEGTKSSFETTSFSGEIAVYLDEDCTTEAAGVTATVSGGTLTVSGVNTDGNTAYYLSTGKDSYVTTIYVVNDEYDENSAKLTLADGTTVNLTTYAPNMANGDYTAVEGKNEIDGETSFFIGANRTAVSLSDLTDTENFKGYEKAAAWFLKSGITNAGDTLTTFGDKFYVYEYAVSLYREFQIVVDEVTAVNGFADPTDFIGAMMKNDPYSDAVSATVQSGVWNGIFTQKSDTKSEGDSGFYLYENIDGVTTLGTGVVTNVQYAYVGAYNAFQSPWASLNDDGEELADALEVAAQDATAAQYKDAGTTSSWSWATESIGKASAADLFHGDNNGNFNAEGTLTRAEFAQVLYNLAGQPAVSKTTNTFKDLSQDWYKNAIEWCYENGIVSGYSATKFGPSDSITREQFAKMLSAYNDLVDLGYDAAGTSLAKFTDGSKTSSWAKTELSWAVGNGLFQGYANGTIQPTKTITRAEAATVMGRVADKLSFDYSNSAKIAAVSEKLMDETTVPAASTTLTKAQAVNVLYACRNYVDSKSAPDESMSEKTGASYSDMSQYLTGSYGSPVVVKSGQTVKLGSNNNLVAQEGSALFVKEGGSATVTNSTISMQNDPTAAENAVMVVDQNRAADGGEADGHVYNATTRNAYYRIGLGSALTNWGGDVVLTSTNGTLVLDGDAGSMAGTAYVGYGGSLQIKNAVAYSSGQHLTNLLYNGTIHYIDSNAIGSGRVFSSDFWGGYQVYEDTIADGGNVTDESTTLIVKNSVFGNSVGGNGFASQYFENSILNVGTANFQNTTSFVTDTGSLTVVNSVVNSSATTLAAAGKGERAIITLVDSTVNLSGNVLATVANHETVNHIDTSTVTTDISAYQHLYDGEMAIKFYGDVELNVTALPLTVDVSEGATLTVYSANLTKDDITNTGKGTLNIVTDKEYGTVTIDTSAGLTVGSAAALINDLMKDSGVAGYDGSTDEAKAVAALKTVGILTDEKAADTMDGQEFDALLAKALNVSSLKGIGEYKSSIGAISVQDANAIIDSVVLRVAKGEKVTCDTDKFLSIEEGGTWSPESTSGNLHIAGLIGYDSIAGINAYGEKSYNLETQQYNGVTIYYNPYQGSANIVMPSDSNSFEICYVTGGGRLYPDYSEELAALVTAGANSTTDVKDATVNLAADAGKTAAVYTSNGTVNITDSAITSSTTFNMDLMNIRTLGVGDAVIAATENATINITGTDPKKDTMTINSLTGRGATALAGATLNIDHAIITNRDGNGSHGVCVLYGSVINIKDSTVDSNTSALSSDYGGGLIIADNVKAYAQERGGGALADGMTFIYVTNSELKTAKDAGASTAGCGHLEIDGSTIEGHGSNGMLYSYVFGMLASEKSIMKVTNSDLSGDSRALVINGNTIDVTLDNVSVTYGDKYEGDTTNYLIHANNATMPASFYTRANVYISNSELTGDIYFDGDTTQPCVKGYTDSYVKVYFGENVSWTGKVIIENGGTVELYQLNSKGEYEKISYTEGQTVTINSLTPADINVGETAGVVVQKGALNSALQYQSGVTIDGTATASSFTGKLSTDSYFATGILLSGSTYTVKDAEITMGTTAEDNKSIEKGGTPVIGAGSGIAVRDGSTVTIEDSTIKTSGAWANMDYPRSGVVAGWQSADDGDVVIMRNTTITNDGNDENTSNVGYFPGMPGVPLNIMKNLTVSGQGRAYVVLGDTVSYLYNSDIEGTGWAAICTDMASSKGLYVYALGTIGKTTVGGYGIYSDGNCYDTLYGSTLQGADFGAIISENGYLKMGKSSDADKDTLAKATAADIAAAADKESVIAGGRNAIMTHATSSQTEEKRGQILLSDTAIKTSKDIIGTTEQQDYMKGFENYLKLCDGAAILIKSSSENVELTNCTVDSYTNTLIEAVVDSDNGGIAAKATAPSNVIKLDNVTTTNDSMDILNKDFQRKMEVTISNMTLKGKLDYMTYAQYQEVNYLDGLNTIANTENAGGLSLTIADTATWTPTAESHLTSLTVNGTLNGTVTVDGKVVTVETGKTYTGTIVVAPIAAETPAAE